MSETWFADAACRGRSPSLWFPETTGRGPAVTEALATCAGCPVRLPCLDYALKRPEYYGIWGGLTEDERAAVRGRKPSYIPKRKDIS